MTDNFLSESHPWFVDVTQPSLLMRIVWTVWMFTVAALILGAFALVTEANAADVYQMADNQGTKVRLLDEPCDVTVGWLKMKKATVRWQGKDYKACWAVIKEFVLVFDDAGDVAAVPVSMFRKEETI